jgi:adenylate kinase
VKVLMVAPPGAGKGTQAVVIAEHFGVPHIATGDLLREHVERGTELGQAVQSFLDRGELVPDEVVLGMVREALLQAGDRGFVVDGSRARWRRPRRCTRWPSSWHDRGRRAAPAGRRRRADAPAARPLAEQGRSDDTEDVIRRRSRSTTR